MNYLHKIVILGNWTERLANVSPSPPKKGDPGRQQPWQAGQMQDVKYTIVKGRGVGGGGLLIFPTFIQAALL